MKSERGSEARRSGMLVTHKDKGNYRRFCAGYSRERATICVNDWDKVTCLKCLALNKAG